MFTLVYSNSRPTNKHISDQQIVCWICCNFTFPDTYSSFLFQIENIPISAVIEGDVVYIKY